jgi:hypothetical protein
MNQNRGSFAVFAGKTLLRDGHRFPMPASLGGYNQVTSNTTARGHLGNHAIAFLRRTPEDHAQNNLDYGLRYDFQTYLKEQYGRMGSLVPTAMNPKLVCRAPFSMKAIIDTCNCAFGRNYPYAFGPGSGLRWQLVPRPCCAPAPASPTIKQPNSAT